MNNDQITQLRFNIALNMKDKTPKEWEEAFNWIVGPKQTIVPVSGTALPKLVTS